MGLQARGGIRYSYAPELFPFADRFWAAALEYRVVKSRMKQPYSLEVF